MIIIIKDLWRQNQAEKKFQGQALSQTLQIKSFIIDIDSAELDLKNYNDNQYYGTLYVGTPATQFTFMFDTGSSVILAFNYFKWIWLPNIDCPANYAQGNVTGYLAKEHFAVDQNDLFNVTNFSFLSVFSGGDVHTMESDGLVGLGVSKIGSKQQDLFVQQLYQQGRIKSYGFTIFIGNQNQKSKLWLGTFLLPTTNDYGPIKWLKLTSPYHWQVALSNVIINGVAIPLTKSKNAVLDSGTSLIYIPSGDYQNVFQYVLNGKNCTQFQGYWFCQCSNINDQTYPTISINLGGEQFSIQPFQYLQTFQGIPGCQIQLIEDTSSQSTYWLLGDNFLRGYYQTYEMNAPRIGLADYRYIINNQFNFSNVVYFQPDTTALDLKPSDNNSQVILIASIVSCLAIIIIISGLILYIFNRKMNKTKNKPLSLSQNKPTDDQTIKAENESVEVNQAEFNPALMKVFNQPQEGNQENNIPNPVNEQSKHEDNQLNENINRSIQNQDFPIKIELNEVSIEESQKLNRDESKCDSSQEVNVSIESENRQKSNKPAESQTKFRKQQLNESQKQQRKFNSLQRKKYKDTDKC
ncbi:pepsinogen a [Stylonychia lemnae]|uniref:Pepsinogen a n=1 Tax=Stylonychia lemnae TaxID=5949 RepID=A0A077ZS95_STYLE|nr:pepsinogen a [Stylonychia lemnae]|eukprot:CDW71316.1 pepsinogen a [Stylonychia lemnae]